MRRTGARGRGRRFAALAATAAAVVGLASPAAYAISDIRSLEWHLDAMHAPEMWQKTTGTGITVAVVDTGVKADHPDLAGQVVSAKDFSGEGSTTDNSGHGTGVADAIAGTGKGLSGKGGYGLAPGAKLLSLKTNAGEKGDPSISDSDALHQIDQAIIYGSDQGAKVINVSQAIRAGSLRQSDIADLKAAVDHASAKGSLVIAGAGNSAEAGNPVMYPAALPGVVAVAATDHDSKTTAESEHGPQIVLSAPGMDISGACLDVSGYCNAHGTSFATGIVSGSVALVWSVHPEWTNNQVLRVLINTAGKPQDGSNHSDFVGFGIIRPRIALTNPGDPGPADVSPLTAAAAPTASGGASAPAASVPADNGGGTAAVASSPKKSSSMGLVIGIGVIGVLLLLVLVVVLIIRSRRNTPPPAAGYPGQQMPQQPPYGGYPMQQQPPAPGAYPPPPQGPTPPQGDNPYAR